MKHIIITAAILICSLLAFAQQEKDIATEKYKVQGNCEMCKKRIEDAAYIKGVKRAEWNKDTKELTVIYRPSKTSSRQVLEHVAKAGHSSDKVTAADTDYEKLPECCHYKTNSCNH